MNLEEAKAEYNQLRDSLTKLMCTAILISALAIIPCIIWRDLFAVWVLLAPLNFIVLLIAIEGKLKAIRSRLEAEAKPNISLVDSV